jgi:flagellar assembly protein FliH
MRNHVVAFDRPLAGVTLPGHAPRRYTEADLAGARAAGYREGTDAARAFADQQLVELRADMQTLSEGVFSQLTQAQRQIEEQVCAALPLLAVEVGQRLLAGFVPPPEVVEKLCREALDQLYPERDGLELVVGPRDSAVLERLVPAWRGHFPNLKLTTDDELNSGDCLVRSRFGVTDARGAAKLEGIRQQLTGA